MWGPPVLTFCIVNIKKREVEDEDEIENPCQEEESSVYTHEASPSSRE